jgi:uncharacterized repeat protein (TIGR01451 family)
MRRLGNALSIWAVVLSLLVLLFGAIPATADTPVNLFQSLAGNINITGTGGTLRTAADGVNSCSVTNSGSMSLSGIPAGATVRTAYLYWAGSGGDPQGGVGPDYNVTFNGTAVTADRTYTAWYLAGYNLYFFGGVKDVTAQVTGNGVYTFADLTVQTANVGGGGQYCTSAAVLSAYSLMVVYEDPAEILHVVNIWEGFQGYRGAAITLTPTNFIVPSPAPVTALSSRILILTWEGDSGNSGAQGGFNENLTFCSPTPCAGAALTDAYNPLNNQFNSTIDMPPSGPFSGIDTAWGSDLDMYDLTSRIPAGAASAQSVYSSGGDLVILMNQTMSIPNVPVADLAITKSHAGNFTVGTNGVYTLGGITNNGPSDATGTITVTDTLPAGLTYVSAAGTGWACDAVGHTVTCTRPGPLAVLASAPSITLTVSVGAAAFPGVTNTVSVTSGAFDNVAANSTNVGDPTTVLAPDLSTSAKTWVDLSGGDQDPGDTLRYTITITETGGAAASGVSVADTVPATLTGLSVVNCPAGAACNAAGQTLSVSNVSLPTGGSVTVVFDVVIAGGTPVGTLIDNSAAITNPVGPGATPAAPTVIVSQSSIPQSGNKPLYLYGAPGLQLSRTPTPGAPAYVNLLELASVVWTQAPVLQADSTLDPSVNPNVPVNLYLASNNAGGQNRDITVSLVCSSGGTVLTANRVIFLTTAVTAQTFNLPLGAALTCTTGNRWVLTIRNNTTGAGSRELSVYPVSGGNISRAVLPTTTVINVDSVAVYDAAYPVGSAIVTTLSGTTVYVRSMISDPFGSFDITSAGILITDSTGSVRVNGAAMTEVADSGAATKTYEYVYAVPAGGPAGAWTARVTGAEGTEGTVTDLAQTALNVVIPMPSITAVKAVSTYSDPYNNTTNPKSIPGAVMLYTVTVVNSGLGPVDADSMAVTDPISTNTIMCVSALCSNPPVAFTCSAVPACGLTYNYAAAVTYTNQPGGAGPYNYTPVPDASGFDAAVTGFRVNPAGAFNGVGGPPYSQFTLQFRVKIK